MASKNNPTPKIQSTPRPQSNHSSSQEIVVNRRKSIGVNQSKTASSFFGPPDSKGKCTCLIENCGDVLVANKTTKANFVNHIARKHPGEWKLALEASKNTQDSTEPSSSPTPSQSTPTYKAKGPLEKIMLVRIGDAKSMNTPLATPATEHGVVVGAIKAR
ncbi:hypothetical protein PTTG_09296 [Puccinia triticina 1-1 BBBD Race 1]|uniref:Uncharacterized protein n=1 Tax=Puccinia triticina (isolate 1-1 / race 1 (BBBD)) TaxID=630390 RepID=A0A0C4F809_PUCT1|nr:hypothetical protein PTTG_09296 [Puccinia triticina 1-1 BBBD Race 1]